MAKTAWYVREVVIPDSGNAFCRYWAVTPEGQRIDVTAGAFNSARRKGATWALELTHSEDWEREIVSRRNWDGTTSILFKNRCPQPTQEPVEVQVGPTPCPLPEKAPDKPTAPEPAPVARPTRRKER